MYGVVYREVEEAALAAWPGLSTESLDGWELRAADGFTRRANSVQALGPSTRALPEKITECERWYAAAGLPCLFRITPFTDPALEGHLDERGYVQDGRSHVMIRALDDGDSAEEPETLELAEWIEIYARLSRLPAVPRALEALLRSAGPRRVLACVSDRTGAPVSVGMGALDGAAFGLFDLVTRAEARGRGHGRRLIGSLLAWARAHGATRAYLQVLESNERARSLYARVGFRRGYDYWYRVPRDSSPAT